MACKEGDNRIVINERYSVVFCPQLLGVVLMNVDNHIVKSELITRLANKYQLTDVEMAPMVTAIIKSMSKQLINHGRIEIRGFGSFSTRKRKERLGRNPKTGEKLMVAQKHVVHFKTGKALNQNINS